MCVCVYMCMYVCMYMYDVCMFVCIHLCMYVCMYVCIYASMYASTYTCMYASMYVLCVYIQVHVAHPTNLCPQTLVHACACPFRLVCLLMMKHAWSTTIQLLILTPWDAVQQVHYSSHPTAFLAEDFPFYQEGVNYLVSLTVYRQFIMKSIRLHQLYSSSNHQSVASINQSINQSNNQSINRWNWTCFPSSLCRDILFGLLKKLSSDRKPELKLIITSATLDGQKISNFFLGCPVIDVPGRLHPVEILHSTEKPANYLESTVDTIVRKIGTRFRS